MGSNGATSARTTYSGVPAKASVATMTYLRGHFFATSADWCGVTFGLLLHSNNPFLQFGLVWVIAELNYSYLQLQADVVV